MSSQKAIRATSDSADPAHALSQSRTPASTQPPVPRRKSRLAWWRSSCVSVGRAGAVNRAAWSWRTACACCRRAPSGILRSMRVCRASTRLWGARSSSAPNEGTTTDWRASTAPAMSADARACSAGRSCGRTLRHSVPCTSSWNRYWTAGSSSSVPAATTVPTGTPARRASSCAAADRARSIAGRAVVAAIFSTSRVVPARTSRTACVSVEPSRSSSARPTCRCVSTRASDSHA